MSEMVPVATLATALFPQWLRDVARMASFRVTDPDTVRFRVDPGRTFERYAELARYRDFGGSLFGLTVWQRYLPYGDLGFVVSGETHRDTVAETLWRAVSHADMLVPHEYWRTGSGYTVTRPLWAAQADTRQPGAIRVLEALATARARETGQPHFLSRLGYRAQCNINAPYRGEFYSVNPAGEWSLHYHPVTYPLDGTPTSPPDMAGTHPVVLAYLRNMSQADAEKQHFSGPSAMPVVEFLGKAHLPRAACPPEEFYIPFRATGEDTVGPDRTTRMERPAVQRVPEPWNLMKEIPMPESASNPDASINASVNGSGGSIGDPWEGAHAQVHLAPDAARFARAAGLAQAGFVIGISETGENADRACTVHFPGQVGNISVPDDVLVPAPAFPAVTTSHGEIASIESAEALLIDSAARARFQRDQGLTPDAGVDKDRIMLAKALGNMCGIDPQELMRQLEPMIGQQVTGYRRAHSRHPAGTKRASEAAAADIPEQRDAERRTKRPGAETVTAIRSGKSETVPAARPAPSRLARRR